MHIEKHHRGGFRVIVQHQGKRRSAVAPTRAAAKRRGAELYLELGVDRAGLDEPVTLAEMLTMVADRPELAATTREDYHCLVRKVPDWLGSWPISSITASMVEQAYRRLLTEPSAADRWTVYRVRRLHEVMASGLRQAARWRWITASPMHDVVRPAKPVTSITPPSPEEVARLLATAAPDPDFACAIRVVATTGIRRGELCGLQWADFDEQAGTLNVRRSVSTIAGHPSIVTDGKTGSKGHRLIALGLPTSRALHSQRARLAARVLERGQKMPPWVFTGDGVNPWRTDYVTLAFSRVRAAAGVDCSLHDLRHFVATQLLASGVDGRTVAGRLGHASTRMTLDVYAAFLPPRDRDAADYLETQIQT